VIGNALAALGDWGFFSGRAIMGLLRGRWGRGTLVPICYQIGVGSVFVIVTTGLFIGMVLAVQSYGQFHQMGMDSWLGAITNISVVRELGPVLAAVMLAGRVGSAMAAELGTMRVTEQIDALACLGVDPVHYLVTPRLLACVFLIPLLTVLADVMGVCGSALICLQVYHIEPHYYWRHSDEFIGIWDLTTGVVKPMFFGGVIALISCHRGFHSRAGAEGVGRAATEAFVVSFIAILALDFVLALLFNLISEAWWPVGGVRLR
jgi:phospholipid/cholesterol/gamma-HCH transport system permease protein